MRVTFLERREEIHVDSKQDYYRRYLEFSKQLAKRIRFLEAMYFLTAVALDHAFYWSYISFIMLR